MEIDDAQTTGSSLRRVMLIAVTGWTVLVICLVGWNLHRVGEQTSAVLLSQARSLHRLIVTTRYWSALHGGVYVPATDETPPNPYLEIPERDIETEQLGLLTLVNPAYMTRQISELAAEREQVEFHITSLKPLRPGNAPTPWEREALTRFKSEGDEYHFLEEGPERQERVFRYMAPLWTDRACLKCHAKQGYSEGDLRGGISVSTRAGTALASQARSVRAMVVAYSLIWAIGIVGAGISYRVMRRDLAEREGLIERLRNALSDVKTLRGLIPICASCKKIRDDQGYWERIETYISERSEAEFSHGICPGCMKELYPEYSGDDD